MKACRSHDGLFISQINLVMNMNIQYVCRSVLSCVVLFYAIVLNLSFLDYILFYSLVVRVCTVAVVAG